jgi:hypothetical protein
MQPSGHQESIGIGLDEAGRVADTDGVTVAVVIPTFDQGTFFGDAIGACWRKDERAIPLRLPRNSKRCE